MMLATWSFGAVGVSAGWPNLRDGGCALDAVVGAATAVEEDPGVDSVGLGGVPDAEGAVSLDACVMESPTRAGAVYAVRGMVHATKAARLVMERTRHVSLAGVGAEAFAERCGIERRSPLTDRGEAIWRKWYDRTPPAERAKGWAPPANVEERTNDSADVWLSPSAESNADGPGHDTVGILALGADGRLAGACTTSGAAVQAARSGGRLTGRWAGALCRPRVRRRVRDGGGGARVGRVRVVPCGRDDARRSRRA